VQPADNLALLPEHRFKAAPARVHKSGAVRLPFRENGVTYYQCGTVWYQPKFAGTTVTYVVVAAPR
jgi:hypothetical protein